MSIFDRLNDAAVAALTQQETIRLPYTELVKIVAEEFIAGADDAFLEKVKKTAKGGFAIFPKELTSSNERYTFHVGTRHKPIWLSSKPVWILDNQTNTFYQLDKSIRWKKFYNAVDAAIKMEKINRTR